MAVTLRFTIKYFQESVEQGHADAQCSLGMAYENSVGVSKKDLAQAIKWYKKAAIQGHSTAQKKLKILSDSQS
ncbi:MAG: sel1 repeat family protein [Thioploca sp.]|nr:sel1 repeat family protein [Thioploca sp.]